ncbi:MAG: DUF4389 domain-containing protein [Dehalococcoidia bacterium]
MATVYPVTFDVEYPERLSRWKIFVKWLLIFPHILVLYLLGLVQGLITFAAWFIILITAQYPKGLFDFVVGVMRWQANVNAYVMLLRDDYPPFSMEDGRYAVTFRVEHPERLSRLLIFVKWLFIIPHLIVLCLVGLAYMVTLVIAWFAILFTGRYPRGLFSFAVGVFRWSMRINVYYYLLRDEYPPFSLQ